MTAPFRLTMAAVAALSLTACGASKAPAASAGTRAPPAANAARVRTTPPPVFRAPPAGDPILGRNADAVAALLGAPRLDSREGNARKQQFVGAGCVVDIYYYAPRAGSDAVATHIDARGSDGRDADRVYCINAMSRR